MGDSDRLQLSGRKGPTLPKAGETFAEVFDEVSGEWVRVKDLHNVVGHLGEQDVGFFLGERGYFFVDGPSGSSGHRANAPGFDGVAYNPRSGELLIYDNKASYSEYGEVRRAVDGESLVSRQERLRSRGRIYNAPPVDPNVRLPRYLDDMIQQVRRQRGMPYGRDILNKLVQMRLHLAGRAPRPPGVRIAVINARGHVTEVGGKLARSGMVEFIDYYSAPRPERRQVPDVGLRFQNRRLNRSAVEAERQAAEAAERRVAGRTRARAAGGLRAFLAERFPRIVSARLVRIAQSRAARRAGSLLPVLGWVFAGRDAFEGVRDILRGNVARGMAGISLAGADVSSDFLHLGNAVSGVGGTALSLGAQGATIAGQIKIELDRAEERFEELAAEIERLGGLPDEGRLKGYYDLDDEAIGDLRRALAQH